MEGNEKEEQRGGVCEEIRSAIDNHMSKRLAQSEQGDKSHSSAINGRKPHFATTGLRAEYGCGIQPMQRLAACKSRPQDGSLTRLSQS